MKRYRCLVRLLLIGLIVSVLGASPYAVENGPQFSSASLACSPLFQRSQAIPIEVYGNRIYLQVKVNRSGPFRFILDTGAQFCVINRTRSAEMGVSTIDSGHGQIAGAGENKTRISTAKDVSLSFSTVDMKLVEIVALPFDDVEPRLGGPIYGALGYELFDRYIVEIDYAGGTLSLFDPKSYQYSGQGESIPIGVSDRVPKAAGRVLLAAMKPLDGVFLIDTGMGAAVELNAPFIAKNGLSMLAAQGAPLVSAGVGGTFRSSLHRLNALRIGSFQLENLTAVFSRAESGATASNKQSGNIGGEILRRFRVIFDYSRKRMILEPSSVTVEPFEGDMSGAYLIAQGTDFKTIRVQRVFENTPAAEAGLREGDVIDSVDGKAAAELTLERVRQMFRRDGKEYLMTVRRGQESVAIKLRVRRMV